MYQTRGFNQKIRIMQVNNKTIYLTLYLLSIYILLFNFTSIYLSNYLFISSYLYIIFNLSISICKTFYLSVYMCLSLKHKLLSIYPSINVYVCIPIYLCIVWTIGLKQKMCRFEYMQVGKFYAYIDFWQAYIYFWICILNTVFVSLLVIILCLNV